MHVQHRRSMITASHQPRRIAALVLIFSTLAAILALAIARPAPLPAARSAPAHRARLTGVHTTPITAAARSAYDGQVAGATRARGPITVARSPIQQAASSAYAGQFLMRPAAPAVALPRGDASQPNTYWEYLRLSVSGLAVPEEVQKASLSNGHWDYVRPESGYQIWYESVHGRRPQD